MTTNRFRALLAGAVVAAGLVAGAGNAQAASVTVSGKLGASAAGWSILLVSPKGTAVVGKADATGAFSISASKTTARNATLQMVDTANRYVGPIVIAKEKVGKNTCAHLKLSGSTAKLGTLTLASAGWAIAKKAPKANLYSRAAVLAKNAKGQPLAAGSGGIVKLTRAQKTACARARVGKAGVSAMDASVNSQGSDLDSDGLPNALDADDDGDKVIDAVDPNTTQSAAMNPWISLRSTNPLFNAAVNGNLSSDDVNAVLGDPGSYVIQFFIGQRNLVSGDALSIVNNVSWVWVDCGNLAYCGGANPTALIQSWHNGGNNTGMNWSTYNGGFGLEDQSKPATSGINQDLGANPGNNGNALYLMNRNGQNDVEYVYWRAAVAPNQGSSTLDTVKPGDVFTLRYSTTTGEQQLPMMLNPHAITIPGLVKVNNVAYTGGPLVPDANGKLALVFHRPQRLTTAGENGRFKDMGGLHYGIMYAKGQDTGCAVNSYSDYDTNFTYRSSTNQAELLWPLTDKQVGDTDTQVGEGTMSFTVDFKKCVGASDYATGAQWTIELVSAGESLTGGSNRASLQMTVTKPTPQ